MPRVCTICTHPERETIDAAIVGGEPYRSITERFSVSTGAIARHKSDHIPATLAQATEAQEIAHAGDLLAQVRDLHSRALAILGKAEKGGDLRTALSGIAQARACLELLAKLLGELDERPQINLLLTPEWQAIRAAVWQALRPYPEARLAVAERLAQLEGRGDSGA